MDVPDCPQEEEGWILSWNHMPLRENNYAGNRDVIPATFTLPHSVGTQEGAATTKEAEVNSDPNEMTFSVAKKDWIPFDIGIRQSIPRLRKIRSIPP